MYYSLEVTCATLIVSINYILFLDSFYKLHASFWPAETDQQVQDTGDCLVKSSPASTSNRFQMQFDFIVTRLIVLNGQLSLHWEFQQGILLSSFPYLELMGGEFSSTHLALLWAPLDFSSADYNMITMGYMQASFPNVQSTDTVSMVKLFRCSFLCNVSFSLSQGTGKHDNLAHRILKEALVLPVKKWIHWTGCNSAQQQILISKL